MAKANRKLLDDMCEEMPCHKSTGDYCVLKELLLHDAKYNNRLLCQFGCLDKLKYEISEKEGKDCGLEKAMEEWVSKGYAKKFADVWEEEDTIKSVWKKILKK